MLRAPPGSRVAIYEFEDPRVPRLRPRLPHRPSGRRKVQDPLLRHDFPLKLHIWSFDAAVIARYMQDKISPQFAEEISAAPSLRIRPPCATKGRSQRLHPEIFSIARPRDALRDRSQRPLCS